MKRPTLTAPRPTIIVTAPSHCEVVVGSEGAHIDSSQVNHHCVVLLGSEGAHIDSSQTDHHCVVLVGREGAHIDSSQTVQSLWDVGWK